MSKLVKDTKKVADALAVVLASTYTLYLKTQNFHWNVTGSSFNSLHAMFMAQYTALALANDEIAERIRALGHHAPGGYGVYGKLSKVKDAPEKPIKAAQMIQSLLTDHENLGAEVIKVVKIAQDQKDELTADLMIKRGEAHDKTAWMLRSLLEK